MKKITPRNRLKWSGLVWAGTILLTACTAGPPAGIPLQSEQADSRTAVAADPAADQEAGASSSQPAATNAGLDVQLPTPRAGLVATDPASVVLASGDIQLVEFFAFW